MKLYQKFLSLSRGQQIALTVFTLHALAVFCLFCHHWIDPPLKPTKIVVRTLASPQPSLTKPIAPKKAEPAVSKAPPSLPQTPQPIPSAPKKTAVASSKKEPAQKSTPPPLVKATKNLETPVEPSVKPSRTPLLIPSKIASNPPSQTSSPTLQEGPTYAEFLISHLKSSLDLPEYGEVKMKLEIDRFGTLIRCEIVETKSQKNADFLKKQLPDLTFPCLNDFGIFDTTHIFTVTFRNEETPF